MRLFPLHAYACHRHDALIHAFKICAVLWKNGPEET